MLWRLINPPWEFINLKLIIVSGPTSTYFLIMQSIQTQVRSGHPTIMMLRRVNVLIKHLSSVKWSDNLKQTLSEYIYIFITAIRFSTHSRTRSLCPNFGGLVKVNNVYDDALSSRRVNQTVIVMTQLLIIGYKQCCKHNTPITEMRSADMLLNQF